MTMTLMSITWAMQKHAPTKNSIMSSFTALSRIKLNEQDTIVTKICESDIDAGIHSG